MTFIYQLVEYDFADKLTTISSTKQSSIPKVRLLNSVWHFPMSNSTHHSVRSQLNNNPKVSKTRSNCTSTNSTQSRGWNRLRITKTVRRIAISFAIRVSHPLSHQVCRTSRLIHGDERRQISFSIWPKKKSSLILKLTLTLQSLKEVCWPMKWVSARQWRVRHDTCC